MMELSPELQQTIAEKVAVGRYRDAEEVVAAALDLMDRAEAIAGVERGLADLESGRIKPLARFIAEQRARHGL